MGLETGTYISSLNASNPTTSDAKTEGDDHIRLIKSTILTTFPNITGAVTPTHTELNYVDGVTSAIQTQLDGKVGNANWSFNANRWVNGGNTQPSFRAYLTGNQTSGNTIVWNATHHNYGTNFSTSTGLFTAPIDGVYLFTCQVLIANATGSTTGVYAYIRKNGAGASGFSKVLVTTGENVGVGCSLIVEMTATDTASVVVSDSMGGALSANLYAVASASMFSGRLMG